jgi:hypothetical protein
MAESKTRPKPKPLVRQGKEDPTTNSHLIKNAIVVAEAAQKLDHRQITLWFLLVVYSLLLASTLVIIFFQGFKYHGFQLESGFLRWLGGATIAEVAVIAGFVYRSLFQSSSKPPKDT